MIEEIWTPFQKTKDYSAALTQAANSGAQMIYAFYAGSEAIQVVKQHADFGLREKIPLIGDHWVYDEALWPALGDLVLKAKHVATHFPGIDTPTNKKFVDAFRKKFNMDPDVSSELGYDNGKAIMLTFEKLGGKMPEDKAKFVSTMRELTFDAPRGKIVFNAYNSAQLEKVYIVEIVKGADGKPVLAPIIVQKLAEVLLGVKASGIPILLVEQNFYLATSLADFVYVLSQGRVQFSGTTQALIQNENVKRMYLSV